MTRAGFKGEVLKSFTIWLCTSCYACTVVCPKEIQITDVMYALKRRAIREGIYPRRFPIPILAREFFRTVWKRGRNSEGRLILRLLMRTNPLELLKQAATGARLWLKGRLSLRIESVRHREEIQRVLPGPRSVLSGKGAQA